MRILILYTLFQVYAITRINHFLRTLIADDVLILVLNESIGILKFLVLKNVAEKND